MTTYLSIANGQGHTGSCTVDATWAPKQLEANLKGSLAEPKRFSGQQR